MKIGTNSGHTLSGLGSGAIGFLNESSCTRQINNHFIKLGKAHFTVYNCSIDKSTNYLYEVVRMANKHDLDYAISHHLNSSDNEEANGVEILVYDLDDKETLKVAKDILSELVKLGFRNRGVKERKDLYWLSKTNAKALLIEYLFVSSKSDVSKYNPEQLARAVVNALIKDISVGPIDLKYPNGDYNRKATIVNTNNTSLNVRSKRSVNSTVLGKFKEGQIISVYYCKDNWFSTYDVGQLGFINGAYVKLL